MTAADPIAIRTDRPRSFRSSARNALTIMTSIDSDHRQVPILESLADVSQLDEHDAALHRRAVDVCGQIDGIGVVDGDGEAMLVPAHRVPPGDQEGPERVEVEIGRAHV